ncbi:MULTISPECIES: TraE/TraK family type IV conjugative transfer system protein [Enterobacterales]|uniref:TraE/TraK family type IV conjugative transfer system protein n=1 Tax=Enterobacterales TaxID=91347 RepID=UPI0009BBEF5A|nr:MULTISPECIES: TraE/TraK family type IV conjugative transfer system protein [Enterobacteriaceae]HBQ9086411.1 traE family protein [Klebsiella quasipneumoniae]HED2943974.1 traE family protein [Enterobacter hormaechei subsp. xiangfangensis]MBC4399120.1 traE family protein [Klebsiella pneumoniae]RIU55204.1 traE family protein [Klebsiella pneumoniae]TXQ48788.1 traE family protein [Escherichia coli]
MNSRQFKKGLLQMAGEISALKWIVLGLLGVVVILSATLMSRSQVVTIIPPNLTQTAWLDENAASAPYMRAWAVYVAQSLGNANPTTVDMVKDAIGPFLDAKIYTETMKRIDDQIDQIKRDRISLYFSPNRVITDPAAPGVFYVEGNQGLEGISGAPVVKPMTFQVNVDIKGYRPVITYVNIAQGKAVLPSDANKRRSKDNARGNK